jgi:hypothetical protein
MERRARPCGEMCLSMIGTDLPLGSYRAGYRLGCLGRSRADQPWVAEQDYPATPDQRLGVATSVARAGKLRVGQVTDTECRPRHQ